MSPIQGDLETGRPRLSTMSFIDPQHDTDRQHVVVRATQPRPLTRELRQFTDAATALLAAKRFAGGDSNAALQALPEGIRTAAGEALRQAFDAGFGAAAWTASGVALTALLLTRWLMPKAAAAGEPTLLVVPGE